MEGDERGRTVGNQDGLSLHVDENLPRYKLLRVLLHVLVGFKEVHLLNFLGLLAGFNLTLLEADLELLDFGVMKLSLMLFTLSDFVKPLYVLVGFGSES